MRRNFAGSRIIKTGIATFLTAVICNWIGWPPVFAVITAIVTIEPTISDSIRKGIVRFPASAIGSAFSVIFISFFGNSPITYTLAAIFTIAACYKLRLHDGLLVATITAVAMIEVTSSSLLLAFFIRLGTTSIGLFVSTVVNIVIFPPSYRINISRNLTRLSKQTAHLLRDALAEILVENKKLSRHTEDQLTMLREEVVKTEQFIRFERDELKYHFFTKDSKRDIIQDTKQKESLRRILNHVDNLQDVSLLNHHWQDEEKKIAFNTVELIASILEKKKDSDSEQLQLAKQQLTTLFWTKNKSFLANSENDLSVYPAEFKIYYELIAIMNETEAFLQAKSH